MIEERYLKQLQETFAILTRRVPCGQVTLEHFCALPGARPSDGITREEAVEFLKTRPNGHYQQGRYGHDTIFRWPATNSINLGKAAVRVKHAQLDRVGESAWKSRCPVCEVGVLLVQRASEDNLLLAQDNCIACGQRFIYDDIEQMRQHDSVVEHHEADMSISGYKLSQAQSLTVRVALQSFGLHVEEQLKTNGRDALYEAYLKRIGEINALIMRSAK